ncbi:MAG: hypothetical protein ACK511_00560, partial [Burkholderiales bacterium]
VRHTPVPVSRWQPFLADWRRNVLLQILWADHRWFGQQNRTLPPLTRFDMSSETFGIIELIAFFGIALALLGREYWSLNRDKKRAAEEKRKQQQAAQPPAEG